MQLILLQNATEITKCNVYYKLRHILQFPPLLQSYRVSSINTSIQNIYQLTDFKTRRVFRGYRKIQVEWSGLTRVLYFSAHRNCNTIQCDQGYNYHTYHTTFLITILFSRKKPYLISVLYPMKKNNQQAFYPNCNTSKSIFSKL